MAAGAASPVRFTDAAERIAGVMGALLGWSPDAFWAATPREVAGVLSALGDARGEGADAPPDGATIRSLMEAFPDERRCE